MRDSYEIIGWHNPLYVWNLQADWKYERFMYVAKTEPKIMVKKVKNWCFLVQIPWAGVAFPSKPPSDNPFLKTVAFPEPCLEAFQEEAWSFI